MREGWASLVAKKWGSRSRLPQLLSRAFFWGALVFCAYIGIVFGVLRGDEATRALLGAWGAGVALGWAVLHPLSVALSVGWHLSAAVAARQSSLHVARPLSELTVLQGRLLGLAFGKARGTAAGCSVAAALARGAPLKLAAAAVAGRAHLEALAEALDPPLPQKHFVRCAMALRVRLLLAEVGIIAACGGTPTKELTFQDPGYSKGLSAESDNTARNERTNLLNSGDNALETLVASHGGRADMMRLVNRASQAQHLRAVPPPRIVGGGGGEPAVPRQLPNKGCDN